MNTSEQNTLQYGPYSPQEVDRVSSWLKEQNIQFEILRNDQEARESLMNDGQNVVNLADLRTGVYLAQIFYISLKNASESQKVQFENKFTPQNESFSKQTAVDLVSDQTIVHSRSIRHQYKKRSWAIFLAFLLISQILVAFYHIIFKES